MEKGKLVIRKAEVEDACEIMKLHERSVLGLCQNDYSAEQLKGWVQNSNLEKYQKRLRLHRTWIAEVDKQTVGYVRWNPATNELCSIFVDPKYARQGIATKLMSLAYNDAIESGTKEMWLDASLTAVPFYKAQGWKPIKKMTHGPLECIRMHKQLLSLRKIK